MIGTVASEKGRQLRFMTLFAVDHYSKKIDDTIRSGGRIFYGDSTYKKTEATCPMIFTAGCQGCDL
jgi:hypothetical protein